MKKPYIRARYRPLLSTRVHPQRVAASLLASDATSPRRHCRAAAVDNYGGPRYNRLIVDGRCAAPEHRAARRTQATPVTDSFSDRTADRARQRPWPGAVGPLRRHFRRTGGRPGHDDSSAFLATVPRRVSPGADAAAVQHVDPAARRSRRRRTAIGWWRPTVSCCSGSRSASPAASASSPPTPTGAPVR